MARELPASHSARCFSFTLLMSYLRHERNMPINANVYRVYAHHVFQGGGRIRTANVGFSSLSYFNKSFKEQFGMTPGQFAEASLKSKA